MLTKPMSGDPQEQTQSSELVLMALFARVDTVAMSSAVALASALALAAATAALLLAGAPPGVPVGPNLSALRNVLPGYRVTWLGCLVGGAWGGAIGAVVGFLLATCWNFIHFVSLGAIALFYERDDGSRSAQGHGCADRPVSADLVRRDLLSSVVRLNVGISAVGLGLSLGLLLFAATHMSIAVSDRPGRYLNLLRVFMPGYSASSEGAWFGLLWGLIYGALSGGTAAWLYARSLGARLPALVTWDEAALGRLRPPVLRISIHALGIALGVVAALQLMLATLWLVVRGTAAQSVHAQLLSHYLPGYTVSGRGSLFGALELFLLVYLFSALVGEVYNLIARARHEGVRK
jgi:hypothetical protein